MCNQITIVMYATFRKFCYTNANCFTMMFVDVHASRFGKHKHGLTTLYTAAMLYESFMPILVTG